MPKNNFREDLTDTTMSLLKFIINSSSCLRKTPLSFWKYSAITRFSSTVAPKTKEPNDWESIYKFPYIEFVAAANKLKIYQAVFSVAAVPASFLLQSVDAATPLMVFYIGLSGFATLSAVSYAFKDTVGFVYVSKKSPDLVKIATVDFWGKRKDEVFEIENIMAFSEMPRHILDKYVTFLQFFNGHSKMKLLHKYGGIYDINKFNKVFGEDR